MLSYYFKIIFSKRLKIIIHILKKPNDLVTSVI